MLLFYYVKYIFFNMKFKFIDCLAIVLHVLRFHQPTRKRPTRMSNIIKQKRLTFTNKFGLYSKARIQPLQLIKIKRLKYQIFNIIKYECFKPLCLPVKPTKRVFYNVVEFKTDIVNDEKMAAELSCGNKLPDSQLSFKANRLLAKAKIFKHCKNMYA